MPWAASSTNTNMASSPPFCLPTSCNDGEKKYI